ncbi:IclR family transcriptional regulator [Brevibacterium sp. UCMA 11754]|uniref:IclR family transcriptional regulator n=1 Tax=Brevibacterium sp. UCMA 11754 TaxID=2749198 RepID=UPI00228572E2|nr:IclR family transcriptional regulator C-terminal domain-containing protein [Brevibacterium sp. UCMA 11754]MCF2572405.1 helix-turn-helix domain-containing protein [Brevibacterium sp. UCMA 11754]
MTSTHRTVNRIVRILESVARSEATAVSLATLARELEAPKSSVYGFVRGLCAEGYLDEVHDGYVLGTGVAHVLGPAENSVVLLIEDVLEEISARTGETVTVAVRVASSVVYVHSLPADYEVCYVPQLKVRRPLLPTSSGKLFFALQPKPGDEELLAGFEPDQRSNLQAELPGIRSSGTALNRGETVPDVAATAVGVFVDSVLTAAITIAGPFTRTEPHLQHYGEIARELLNGAGFGQP